MGEGVGLLDQQTPGNLTNLEGLAAVVLRQLQDSQVLLGEQNLERRRLEARSHDYLGEYLGDGCGHLRGDSAVGGNHATESAQRVAEVSLLVRAQDGVLGPLGGNRDAAGVGVLDDGNGRLTEVVGGTQRGIGIHVVVVGHVLAVELARLCDALNRTLAVGLVERGGLVAVLAVAKHVAELAGNAKFGGKTRVAVRSLLWCAHLALPGVVQFLAKPVGNGGVVLGGVAEGSVSQFAALLQGGAAVLNRFDYRPVHAWVHDDCHVGVVLGAGANHRRTTDVDLLDHGIALGATGHGLNKRVEVYDHELESLDVELGQLLLVLHQTQVRQQTGVHLRVQGLDAAVERLRETGDLRNLGHRVAGIGDCLGG